MKQELYIITTNDGKFEECKTFLNRFAPELDVKQKAIDLPEPQTLDIAEVAKTKAEAAWHHLQKPVLIDDGGFFLDQYNNFPGALSKYVMKGIGLEGLKRLAPPGSPCSFQTYIAYADGPTSIHLFKGVCKGTFVVPTNFKPNPQMPYRPLFKPDGSDKTLEELFGNPEFDKYHHRSMALKAFVEWFRLNK